jgi:hypothetical protein
MLSRMISLHDPQRTEEIAPSAASVIPAAHPANLFVARTSAPDTPLERSPA